MSDPTTTPDGLSAGSLQLHALELVIGKIKAGDFTDEDVKRWERPKDMGPQVHQLIEQYAPKPDKRSRSRSSVSPAVPTEE